MFHYCSMGLKKSSTWGSIINHNAEGEKRKSTQ